MTIKYQFYFFNKKQKTKKNYKKKNTNNFIQGKYQFISICITSHTSYRKVESRDTVLRHKNGQLSCKTNTTYKVVFVSTNHDNSPSFRRHKPLSSSAVGEFNSWREQPVWCSRPVVKLSRLLNSAVDLKDLVPIFFV